MSPVTPEQTEDFRQRLTLCLTTLLERIGRIQIGTPKQFPEGWGRAAKGRTVWRIVEEAVVQNLKQHRLDLELALAESAPGEVELCDAKVRFGDSEVDLFLNLKTAAAGSETKKGDVSKAEGIKKFFETDAERQLFVVTLVVTFSADMFIEIKGCLVVPITWLSDIYVNPQNNNLQCCQPKTLDLATRRTNADFVAELTHHMKVADEKRKRKQSRDQA